MPAPATPKPLPVKSAGPPSDAGDRVGENRRSRVAAFSRTAAELYRDVPLLRRLMMRYRPYICPFHLVFDHVALAAGGSGAVHADSADRRARVLDIGCGAGLLLNLLASEGAGLDAVGVDLSRGAIAAAQRAAEHHPPGMPGSLRFIAQAAQDPWPAGPFDAVTIVDLLHHLPSSAQPEVVQRAAQHVAPGGRLIVKDMYADRLLRPAANRLHDLVMAGDWISFPSPSEIIAASTSAGLRLIERRRVDTLWYGHELFAFERTRA
ncbi:MAG: class I SAM-dependent methyltransferase [Planctomycetota bacterium]